MQTKSITPDLSVGPQLAPADVAAAKAAGFRAIVVNRPDGEGADQPDFAEIAAAAAAAGLEARYIPVEVASIGEADIAAFGSAMESLPKPVLAFCRSGTRAAMLWALSEAGKRPLPEILSLAKQAGYDLSGLAPRITQRSGS